MGILPRGVIVARNRSLDSIFADAVQRLTPSDIESERAKQHRESIRRKLEQDFPIVEFFRTGSFGNGTSVRGHSDVDYFAAIDVWQDDSTVLLRRVRASLARRFPNSSVRLASPAVVVPFGARVEKTEIVPAIRYATRGVTLYAIADGDGGWLQSGPHIHHGLLRELDRESGDRLRPLVRFLKWWSYSQKVGVASFYIELSVMNYLRGRPAPRDYPTTIRDIMYAMFSDRLSPARDPMEISAAVPACGTARRHEIAMRKLRVALRQAIDACEAEAGERAGRAVEVWKSVFPGMLRVG